MTTAATPVPLGAGGARLLGDLAVGRIVCEGPWTPSGLDEALTALEGLDVARRPHRVEVDLVGSTPGLRRLLHRAGFRLEGTARGAARDDRGPVDVLRYARLEDDPSDAPTRFTSVMNTVTPRKRLIAHALITDAAGRILLCQTSFKRDFELPGGIVEPGESPRTGVVRELGEEVGVERPVGRILVTDWLPPYLGWEDALELIFEGGVLSAAEVAALAPDGDEIVALHWLDLDEAAEQMTEVAARHLREAVAARASGEALYLEAGRRP